MRQTKDYFHQGLGTIFRMQHALPSYVYTPVPGPGAIRQRERLKAKAKRLGAGPEARWTRQRDRAEMRRVRKQLRAQRKEHAAQHTKGGSATVRTI